MSYMVIFRTADGKPGYQPAGDAEGAVAAVERLRNEDGVDHVRIYRMEEVAFEYKVHYSVQLTTADAPSVVAAPPSDASAGVDEPSGAPVEPSWDDADDDEPTAAPFDQMAVDPAGSPQWSDDEPAAVAPVEPPDPETSEPVPAEAESRRGLFGR